MKTTREIVKTVLKELKEKKLLRESPEGELNAFISDLQECVTELSSLKDQIQTVLSTNLDDAETSALNLMISKVDYISNTLNNIVTKSTGANVAPTDTPDGSIQEDMSNTNGSVNMSVDNIVKKPDVVKKIESGNMTINAIGDDGKPLTESDDSSRAGRLLGESKKTKKTLKEYMVKEGETLIEAFEATNLWNDILNADTAIDNGDLASWFEEDAKLTAVVAKYRAIATEIYNQVKKYPHITLNAKIADKLDKIIYDGSDAYDDVYMYREYMLPFYNNQIKIFKAILAKLAK